MSVIASFDTLKEQWSEKIGAKVSTHELASYLYLLLEKSVRVYLDWSEDNTHHDYLVVGVTPGAVICKAGNNLSIRMKYPKNTSGFKAVRDGTYQAILDHDVQIQRPRNNSNTFVDSLEAYHAPTMDACLDL